MILNCLTVRFQFVSPVSTNKLYGELTARSVVTRESVDELLFSASVFETVDAMSVSCVLVFPRLQSLLWVPDPSWCSLVPPWCSSDPSWCSPVLLWCSPDPSWCFPDPLWSSPALSAPHWWAPALSAPPWRSNALSAPHWWAPALSAPPWRSAVSLWWSSALPWWSSASSAQVWWSSAPLWWSSAQVWWSSAPPWWSSAQVWWSSAPPWWSSAPIWLSSTPPQSPIPPLAHGPGPPSLPLFRLRSTTLLYCAVWRASGSRSLGGGSVTNPVCGLPPNSHQRSPLHHIDSHTTQHTGLHFPSSIALTTHTADCTNHAHT